MTPTYLVVDLFCGAGGTSTGFQMAENGIAKVIACVNHDPKAIESHWKNHPEVKHFEEDIRTLDLTELCNVVRFQKSLYPDALLILWASLECTNFSKAKGGQPRDPDSRTLADFLHRYVEAIHPDYVMIENVVEFMAWGPLGENGKPVKMKEGDDWLRWRREMCAHGYFDEWKQLNSADFGAYTSRNRLFGVFYRPGFPVCWPEPTHSKKAQQLDKKWKPVKDVLDFSDEGRSIFNRKKPLSDRTIERIYAGLVKFIAKGDTSFISKYFSGKPSGKNIPLNGPAGTIKTSDGQALVTTKKTPISLLKYNSINGVTGKHVPPSIEDPCLTIAAQSRLGIVQGEFLAAYYSNGDNVSPVSQPCPTIPTKDRFQLVQPMRANSQNQSVDVPAGSIMTTDKNSIVNTIPFIMPTSYGNLPRSVEEPAPTLQASRRHLYILNPSHGGHTTSADAPCPVIVARQDKAPLYYVQAEEGPVSVAVYDNDTEPMIQIKQFMAAYGLVDIKMRMLKVSELLRIQGFPEGYHLAGNQSDQKKFIGNSVVPIVVKVWIEAMYNQQRQLNEKIA